MCVRSVRVHVHVRVRVRVHVRVRVRVRLHVRVSVFVSHVCILASLQMCIYAWIRMSDAK